MLNANGTYIVGTLLGLTSNPWATDSTKFNHRIGIRTGQREDDFGQITPIVEQVDVQEPDLVRAKAEAETHKGKRVCVPAVFRARKGGAQGAWLSKFCPQGFEIQLLPELKK